jgi:hypothetical protein
MKPIPSADTSARANDLRYSPILQKPPEAPSPANFRRGETNPIHRAYPFLLLASTAIACFFCFMYITKPVIQMGGSPSPVIRPEAPAIQSPLPLTPAPVSPATGVPLATAPAQPSLLPGTDKLPGDSSVGRPVLVRANASPFEETNLSVQHVLTAQAPAGDLCRLVLDVPVIYQSRQLRWTEKDVAQARQLLTRFADYQEKSLVLRSEGMSLLHDWNQLINHSIPTTELRADSPTLPSNEANALPVTVPAGLDTSESIQIQNPGK